MEHCFRAAVACLILAFALLQANPIHKGDPRNEILGFLPSDAEKVSCGRNMTFASPTNVQDHDCAPAFRCITAQLKKAQTNCTHEVRSIDIESMLPSVELAMVYSCSSSTSVTMQANSSDCAKWEQDQKPLAQFVEDIKSWIQLLNSRNH